MIDRRDRDRDGGGDGDGDGDGEGEGDREVRGGEGRERDHFTFGRTQELFSSIPLMNFSLGYSVCMADPTSVP